MKYLQAFINAENKQSANNILDTLLSIKLVAGGLISKGPAKYWWKNNIIASDFYNISAFTVDKNKIEIIKEVKKITTEEAPLIWFVEIAANKELFAWIKNSII